LRTTKQALLETVCVAALLLVALPAWAHNVSDEDAALIAGRTGWQRDKGVTRLRFDFQKAATDQVKALAEAGLGA
jgi:hypothetical protein